jgi:hypothetical protein
MNTEFDPLESELRALRPRDPSPGLKRRIADELAVSPAVPRPSAPRYYGLAVAALAASLLAAALFIRPSKREVIEAEPPLAQPSVAAAFDATLPSVWQLHNAVNRSAGDLDAVLDEHATRGPAPVISFVQIRGLGRSDNQLETLLGEL